MSKKLIQMRSRFTGIDIILTSTVSNEGSGELKRYMVKNKTYCFLGSSGAGKSSLINKLLGRATIKTGDISHRSERGRHTTMTRQTR